MTNRSRGAGSSGQSAVEFALAAPLIFLLLIGVIQVAYLAYGVNVVSNSAREGARQAITSAGTCVATDPNLVAAVQRASSGVLVTVTNATAGVGLVGATTPAGSHFALAAVNTPGAYCEVTVSWVFKPFSGALKLPTTTITSTSRQYYNADLTRSGRGARSVQVA